MWLLILAACIEGSLDDDRPPNAPIVVVREAALDFGSVRSDAPVRRTITVSNAGFSRLLISGVVLDAPPVFSLWGLDGPHFALESGEARGITVELAPVERGAVEGVVRFGTSDPAVPEIAVPLAGVGAWPELAIEGDLDVEALVGCVGGATAGLRNVGTAPLVVSDLSLVDPSGELAWEAPSRPFVVEPGGVAPVAVTLAPWTPIDVSARIEVTSSDPVSRAEIPVLATGAYGRVVTEAWDAPADPPLDILLVVDQSGSMDQRSEAIAEEFEAWIAEIGQYTTDWRIGVVSLETGCFPHGILSPETEDLTAKFEEAVGLGEDLPGDWSEDLFALSTLALGQAAPGGCNEGFLRPGAALHVVFVSDGTEGSGISAADWLASVRALVGADWLVRVSGVVCPEAGCPGPPEGSGAAYAEAIAATGGERLDILADWGASAASLARATVTGIVRLPLSDAPHAPSASMTLDGAPFSGWTFDFEADEVVFTEAVPPGAAIRLTYGVLVDCP